MHELYERIVTQTNNHDISGKDLGALLGLKKSPLTDWKNHKSNPTLEQLIKMCEIFAVSADYLLFGTEGINELSDIEKLLLDRFSQLSSDDKFEIIDIIELKLRRHQGKNSEELSPSTAEKLA